MQFTETKAPNRCRKHDLVVLTKKGKSMTQRKKTFTIRQIICYVMIFGTILAYGYICLRILDKLANVWSVSKLFFSYNEFRDYVGIRLSQFVMQGINPYLKDTATSFTVPFLYQYTGITPVLVGLLCKITHVGIIEANYFFNFFFVILTSYNYYLIFKDSFSCMLYKILLFACILLNTCTFFSMAGNLIVTFRPDALGLYICSLIYLIANKKANRAIPLSVLSVLLILTKQFLIIFAVPLFAYLVMLDIAKSDSCSIPDSARREEDKDSAKRGFNRFTLRNMWSSYAFRYIVGCLMTGLALFFLVRILFPLYWTESIYGQFLSTGRYDWPLEAALENIRDCFLRYKWYWIVGMGCFFIFLIRVLLFSVEDDRKTDRYNFIRKHGFAVYLLLNIISAVLTCTYIARNGGDGYKYCGELIGPSLFLIILYLLTCIKPKQKNKEIIHSTMLTILAVMTVGTIHHFQLAHYTVEDIENYDAVYSVLDQHLSGQMYLGMGTTGWLIKNGLVEPENIFFNDGHVEYFNTDTTGGSVLEKFLFYGKEDIGDIAKGYVNEVNDKVSKKEFSVITTAIDVVVERPLLEENYYLFGSYNLKADNNSFDTEIWLPKK